MSYPVTPPLAHDVEREVRLYAPSAVAAAVSLIDRGAKLEDLAAVIRYAEDTLCFTVGQVSRFYADAPELAFLLLVIGGQVPPGHLPWLALLGSNGVAWGAFKVASSTPTQM